MEYLKIVLTAFLSAVSLFIIAKIMGHKQVAQLDFFDYVTGITIGSIAAEMATELETPLQPLTAMAVYGIIAVSLSIAANKYPKVRSFFNGSPTVIMSGGKIYRENMRKAKLDLNEFLLLCRQAGYFHLNTIQTAIFEYNGQLTILPVSEQRPAVPADLNLTPPPDYPDTEVIMDGKIIEKSLKSLGVDSLWLKQQLTTQGYKDAKEIYLGICDKDKNLSLYPIKNSK